MTEAEAVPSRPSTEGDVISIAAKLSSNPWISMITGGWRPEDFLLFSFLM